MESVSKTALLVCGTVAFVVCIGAYVTLSWLKLDTAAFLTFIGAAAVILLPGLATLKKTQAIEKQTNGLFEQMREDVTALTEMQQDIKALHIRMDKVGGVPQ